MDDERFDNDQLVPINRRKQLSTCRRVVIKIGSALLVDRKSGLKKTSLDAICEDILAGSANERAILSIAVVDAANAEPGTEVTVLWGEAHPSSKVQVEDHRQVRIRATVQPAPLVAKARTDYRSNSALSGV